MSNTSNTIRQSAAFGRIMLCVDSAEDWADAATFVTALAGADSRACILGLLENARAMIPQAPLASFNVSAAHSRLQRGVASSVSRARISLESAGIGVDTRIADLFDEGGDSAHALTRAAHAWHADLMVLDARQHLSVQRWTERASQDDPGLAQCSMLVLPARSTANPTTRPRRLLCAVDGSPASLESLREGVKIAAPGALVRAIYVLDRSARGNETTSRRSLQEAFFDEGRAALAKARAAFAESWPAQDFEFETALVCAEEAGDDVAHAIVREAQRWNADAILMGTHGLRGVARWMLGTVSGRVSELTPVPLLLSRRRAAR